MTYLRRKKSKIWHIVKPEDFITLCGLPGHSDDIEAREAPPGTGLCYSCVGVQHMRDAKAKRLKDEKEKA